MSVSAILIAVLVIGWNLFKMLLKSQVRGQSHHHQPVEPPETRPQSEASFAELYGIPASTGRTGGISEGQTVEWESLEPPAEEREVKTNVHTTLTDMQESQREIVHPSTHLPSAPAQTVPPKRQPTALLTKQNLRQAIVLREVLGEPRAKRPWRPNRQR